MRFHIELLFRPVCSWRGSGNAPAPKKESEAVALSNESVEHSYAAESGSPVLPRRKQAMSQDMYKRHSSNTNTVETQRGKENQLQSTALDYRRDMVQALMRLGVSDLPLSSSPSATSERPSQRMAATLTPFWIRASVTLKSGGSKMS